jgi:hypothetical protein
VRMPNGESAEVPLRRTSDGAFVGTADAPIAGTYAVGVAVDTGTAGFNGGTTAIRGYSAEYEPGKQDRARLERLSQRTGGRGVITPQQVFDTDGLIPGRRTVNIAPWLLGGSALVWVLAVVLWRMPIGGTHPAPRGAEGRRVRIRRRRAARD